MRPTLRLSVSAPLRKQAVVWTDASGESPYLGAVIFFEGTFWYTFWQVPEWLLAQCAKRNDSQIGVLETLAVSLALATFGGFWPALQ